MPGSKKHHHTPVFYLKRWCGDDGKVHVIRKIGGKIARSFHTPDHLGFEYYLYSYDQNFNAADRAEIETKFFSPLDSEGARIISTMIDGRSLERRDKALWAQFLLSARVRTPENVEKIKLEAQQALIREIETIQSDYSKLKQDKDPASIVEWLRVNRPGLIESFGVGQLPKIASNPKAMQDVLSFSWHLVDFKNSSRTLLSSDRPCVYTEGLDKPNCVISLPLSPRNAFFAFRSGSKAERILMNMPTSKLAAALNQSVVGQAVSRAYSQSIGDAPDKFFSRFLSVSA